MENINLKIEQANGELIIRTGSAKPIYDPKVINITGTIETPFTWLKTKFASLNILLCHILISIANRTIKFVINETDHFTHTIEGIIELHPNFTKWGINDQSVSYRSDELASLIKMNRFMFKSTEVAMQLVTVFQNFKAKIEKEIELSDDKRGNRTAMQRQVVNKMSIPTDFLLFIPLFKGGPKIEIPVEIEINADTLQCYLYSPLANDILNSEAENMIQDVIAKIKELAPDIAIIYQ